MHSNNIGDPWVDTNLKTHTKVLERAVLDYYARLWGLDPHEKHEKGKPVDDTKEGTAWGYVLSMGSSEGNVYGLLNARDYLSGQVLMREKDNGPPTTFMAQGTFVDMDDHKADNATKPVIFFSADTHYSVAKAAHTLAIPTFGEMATKCGYPHPSDSGSGVWPTEVPSHHDGTINVEALKAYVAIFVEKGHPVLIVLNLGSTYRGAHDNVSKIVDELNEFFWRRPLEAGGTTHHRNNHWIHIDGALGASYLPFLRRAQELELAGAGAVRVIPFDFSIPEVSSIVTSGHKYPGAPWACGIYMTRSELQLRPPKAAEYVDSPDTTFGGSRNAFSAIVLWNHIAKHSETHQVQMIADCMQRAASTRDRLQTVVERHRQDGHDPDELVTRTENSLSIVFPKPNDHIVQKFSLANVTVAAADNDGTVRKSHMFVMPHVSDELVDDLIEELTPHGAFPSTHVRFTLPTPDEEDAGDGAPEASETDMDVVLQISMNRGFS